MADRPKTCPIRERTGDGVSVGRCDHYLRSGTHCPRHGDVLYAVELFARTGKLVEEPPERFRARTSGADAQK